MRGVHPALPRAPRSAFVCSWLSVCVHECVCMSVCVCVCERERERVCVCECECVHQNEVSKLLLLLPCLSIYVRSASRVYV